MTTDGFVQGAKEFYPKDIAWNISTKSVNYDCALELIMDRSS
jgi:hypothetical protein